MTRSLVLLAALGAFAMPPARAATHSFEFVAEHFAEVGMDDRYATLPIWPGADAAGARGFTLQAGGQRLGSGGLKSQGPMFSAAARRPLAGGWSASVFGFIDEMRFSGADRRPLDTAITRTPLALPADAQFTGLGGKYRNTGAGIAFDVAESGGWLGERRWVAGALYQRVELRDFRAAYRVLDGPSAGATGIDDYSGEYRHFTPFAGLALPREAGAWTLTPRVLLAVPLPHRAFQGRITGPGFDQSGDTAQAGNGKHFGDLSVTFGLDATYKPWGVTLELGSLVSQALIERVAHKGIDKTWLVSASVRF